LQKQKTMLLGTLVLLRKSFRVTSPTALSLRPEASPAAARLSGSR